MAEHIFEILAVTRNSDGTAHIAPMGLRQRGELWLLAPFRPSRTLDNLLRERCVSVNASDDVRIYAGSLSGHRDWPVAACRQIDGFRLTEALSHRELVVERVDDDRTRPAFFCRCVAEQNHRPFAGYNRAQAAVLELAILVSRLDRLPADKLDAELAYLQIAIDKTAGERERTAWDWLMQRVNDHRERHCA
ncbi:MAG: DUF447 family protein [Gammaproteobacteria bacterium]|nr:DUF447 family protein [Gammaproteobacteria bacterium]